MVDPEKFRSFELSGWEIIPAGYHQAFGSLTTQTIDPLLDAVRVKSGVRLIDIATGPGYVAAAAAKRGATVLGIDFSSAMIEQATQLHPGIDFRKGDAEHLPLGNGLFDAAVMNFGILHLGRPEMALMEAGRVLRDGGRFAFSIWCSPEETVGFGIVLRAVQTHGEPRIELPDGPPFFRYSDPSECERSLIVAGFESPRVTKVSQVWRLPAGDGLFEAMRDSTVRTAGLLRAQKDVVLEKIRAATRLETEKYRRGEFVDLPMPALVASAVKARTPRVLGIY
jgi:SAM-dependent methyltransferase